MVGESSSRRGSTTQSLNGFRVAPRADVSSAGAVADDKQAIPFIGTCSRGRKPHNGENTQPIQLLPSMRQMYAFPKKARRPFCGVPYTARTILYNVSWDNNLCTKGSHMPYR